MDCGALLEGMHLVFSIDFFASKEIAIRLSKTRLVYMVPRSLCTLLMLIAERILVIGADRSEPIHRSTFIQ